MDFSAAVTEAFGSRLLPLGFELSKPRRWVRGSKAPIREVFDVCALKGASYVPRWGFSLDFVPLMWTRPPRWKRTNKSTSFDLCIDPLDFGLPTYEFHHLPGIEDVSVATLQRVAIGATNRAKADFDRVATLVDIVSLFNEMSRVTAKRFGLENYVQAHLAWGLTELTLGNRAAGEALVARACELHGFDIANPLLVRAIATAREAKP
jgi:hypothetical protein